MKRPSPSDPRIQRSLEGMLSPEEEQAFQADVVRDPALRASYVDQLWLHATLRAEADRLPRLLEDLPEAPPARSALFVRLAWAASLAACAALVLVVLSRRSDPAGPVVATLARTENATWAGSTLPTAERSELRRGTLSLLQGIATVRFASGAEVTIEAPTTLELLDAMHCRLVEGSVTADVPESAHGFTIDTPDLKVVDLGTRFGVTAGAAGDSHVFVFEGEVTLNKPDGEKLRHLTEGRTFHVNSGMVAPSREPSRLTQEQTPDGWTSIPTSFGRGQDTFVRRGFEKDEGAAPLLMVKHSDLPLSRKNERRAFLTFDLSAVRPREIQNAELVLDPEPSGLGFSAMVPDSHFAVYGVTDETGETWTERELRWETAPAMSDAGLDPALTRRLAEFSIPRGGAGGSLTVRGDALAEFLREDTNGRVTLVLVRETGETDPSGLVHAFASKEHPSARPPTLRIR